LRGVIHLLPATVDTALVTGSSVQPTPQCDPLGLLATGLLGAPGLIAAAWGAYRLVIGSATAHSTFHVVTAGASPPAEALPTRETVDLLFLLIWVLAVNLLVPGLIIGWIRLRRLGRQPWRRGALLAVGAASGVVVNLWAWGQLSSLRTSGFVMLAGASLALATAYFLMRPKQLTPAPMATLPGTPPAN
jgi:hypothetical protein